MMCETLHIPLAIVGEGSIHICMDEIPTITIYSRGHAGETDILQQHGLSRCDVEHALARYGVLQEADTALNILILIPSWTGFQSLKRK